MVVDNSLNTGTAVARFCARKGHDARAFGSGKDALAFAPQFSPELVFLDLASRDCSGTKVGKQMREAQNAIAQLIAGLSAAE